MRDSLSIDEQIRITNEIVKKYNDAFDLIGRDNFIFYDDGDINYIWKGGEKMSKGSNRDWGYASSDDKGNLTYTSYEKSGSVNRYSDNGDGGHSHEHWNSKDDYDSEKDSDCGV